MSLIFYYFLEKIGDNRHHGRIETPNRCRFTSEMTLQANAQPMKIGVCQLA